MTENREIFGTISQSGSVLILVHHDIEPPVQLIFDAPVRSDDRIQPVRRERRAEQVVGHFGGGFGRGFAHALDLADCLQAGPPMAVLQPLDLGRNRRRARLDPAMIAVDRRLCRADRACRIIEKPHDVVVQRGLVALQRQRVIAVLVNDLLGYGALAVERIGGLAFRWRARQRAETPRLRSCPSTPASPAISAPR